jgi:hypothetical protein
MQPTIRNRGEDSREPPRGPSGSNTLERRVLGHAQLPNAVGRHRWIPGRQVEATSIDFGQVGEQLGGSGSISSDQGREIVH